ncbi:MAG: RDD family protein [Terricaulis sp.]
MDKDRPIEAQFATVPRSAASTDAGDIQKQRFYPWARFWAKQIDLWLHSAVAGAALAIIWSSVAAMTGEASGLLSWTPVVAYFGAIFTYPITDALLVSATGGSPGRAVFRFAVRRRNGAKPPFGLALSRAWTCLFFGQGIGVASLFAWWASYSNLLQFNASLWDRDAGTEVIHRGPAWWSWLLLLIFIGFVPAVAWFSSQILSSS